MGFSTISGFAGEDSKFQAMDIERRKQELGRGFTIAPKEGGATVLVSVTTGQERQEVRDALTRLGVVDILEESFVQAKPSRAKLGGAPQYIGSF